MSLGVRFARLPRPLARRLLPALRYFNLMRALERRLMARWARRVEGWCVLDVGCGHGPYSLDLACRGATLVGVDLESSAVTDARQTAGGLGLAEYAHFVAGDGAALPVHDQQFDLVICNCVLEHIADDGAALTGMTRSLRPGGLLYLSVDNADHGLALGFLERLPAGVKDRLLQPEPAEAATVSAGLEARLDDLYAILRRYHRDDLVQTLASLGLAILDCRPYLTGVGAAHHEAFHAFRHLDPAGGLGRLLYMLSSLLLYPLAAWSDARSDGWGYGLAVVARKVGGRAA
jgi:SAM-dependent methyltransferase